MALSDLTKAWLLYLGLFFVMMVMFVPGGIASLLLMQMPLLAKKRLGRMLPSYGQAAVAGLVLLAALILTVELVYKVQVDSANGTAMRLFGMAFDAGTVAPWIVAAALWAVGYVAWRWAGAACAPNSTRSRRNSEVRHDGGHGRRGHARAGTHRRAQEIRPDRDHPRRDAGHWQG